MVNTITIPELSHPDLECRVLMMRSGQPGKLVVVYESAYEHLVVKSVDGKQSLGDILTKELGLSQEDAALLLESK